MSSERDPSYEYRWRHLLDEVAKMDREPRTPEPAPALLDDGEWQQLTLLPVETVTKRRTA